MTRQAVLDTNVLISGVLWRGVPYRLLTWAEKSTLSFYSSLDIMTEVYRVLHYPKFQRCIDKHHTSPGELFEKIESLCTFVLITHNVEGVCSDADDEKFLSCAVSAGVNVVVSGDRHLLDLKQYRSIRIITAQDFYAECSTRT